MVHVHGVNKVWFYDFLVYLGCFYDNLMLLTGVLANNCLRCWIHNITLNLVQVLWELEPKLAPFIVVEVLLEAATMSITIVLILMISLIGKLLSNNTIFELSTGHN